MTMEKQRGISISATALEMEYRGCRINLLDTPGHQDFSEDTYRTLMAVDSAIMVLDSAKGIEPQTEKLFRVCRMRGVPILTFINKMDRTGRDPLELLDEVERMLGIVAVPMNWPVGEGSDFKGVYDLDGKKAMLYERTPHGQYRSPVEVTGADDPDLANLIGEQAYRNLSDEVDLLNGTVGAFDRRRFLAGEMTPLFFGSALNNFGVEPFLEAVLDLAPSPVTRDVDGGVIDPSSDVFYGFVFKVQANLDPRHRDRMAFLRVCSGQFKKDMSVYHPRLERNIRLSQAFRLLGRERDSIEEAFPGDVIGVISPGLFTIGDTVTNGTPLSFAKIPRFPSEHFGVLVNDDISRYKQFQKGLQQLEEEGTIQVLFDEDSQRREPIVAAVGALQFDVVLSRLLEEYGVKAKVDLMPYTCVRWLKGEQEALERMALYHRSTKRCMDRQGRLAMLFSSDWDLKYCKKENPEVVFLEMS
jgi:peptide chain release factor 3